MDIAVIGSNMVDLITYTNQMPKKEKLWKHLPSKSDVVGKVLIKRWRRLN